MSTNGITRRQACKTIAASLAGLGLAGGRAHGAEAAPRLTYILGSCMYGTTALEEILPEVSATGATHIDIWPRPHGDQREQVEAMGEERFAAMLERHGVKLGISTRYDLGPLKLADELAFVARLGGRMIVSGSVGPRDARGDDLKKAVGVFLEQMKPHAERAAELGVTIAIENHANALIHTPDSLRWFAEANRWPALGIALAPYHLPQDEAVLAGLIGDLGPNLVHFYAWEHGMGCMTKLPKEQELLQMPGRGTLDFRPILAALGRSGYRGWTEIFMHPVPRGIPILPTTAEVSAEIRRAAAYLEKCRS